MKNFFSICGILLVFLLAIPLFALPGGTSGGAGDGGKDLGAKQPGATAGDTVKVLLSATGKVETVPLKDYLVGAVGAEMPANYQSEALKAQAVACYTYLQHSRQKKTAEKDKALGGADISDDSAKYQAYLSREALKEKWKGSYEQYYTKIETAVSEALGYTVTYGGKPILAAFFSLSSGKTNAAKDYWGTDYPYLKSVESSGDKLSPTLTSTVKLSADELRQKLSSVKGVTLSAKPEEWISSPKALDSGLVAQITIGGKQMTGREVREALGLKSAQFTVAYKEAEGFTFTVKGYGHNVGMSQYGADYMARQGADFKTILTHYYPGATVEKSAE